MITSLRWTPTLMLMLGGADSLLAQLDRPPTGYRSPTVTQAGPAWLKVEATVPTRLDLRWAAVTNAGLYGITRTSPTEPEKLLLEIPAGTGDQDLAGHYYYFFDNLPPRSGGVTFTYRVYALFLGTDGSRNQSAPNPSFSVQAMTPVAPPKLKSRVGLSPIMGRLQVNLTWGSVNMATGYHVFQIARPPTPPLPLTTTTVTQPTLSGKDPSLIIDNVVPGQGGTVCVVTLYAGILKDDTVRSCDQISTRAP